MIKIRQAVERLQVTCRTTDQTPCTTKMAGFLHGLLGTVCLVPRKFQYSVVEVIFGCEIFSFSQLTFHSCKTLIDAIQSNPEVQALLYAISHQIEKKAAADCLFLPGDFKDFLLVCGNENVYPFQE